MPLQELKEFGSEKIALWHITETEIFFSQNLFQDSYPNDIINQQKRLEWLAGRVLLKHLAESMGIIYEGIVKDQFGKPHLKNQRHQISLSHSYPYVAAQIHENKSVGIDIEQPTDKLLKIGSRVLDPVELKDAGTDIIKHCVYWCAKEALYKLYGKRGLLFTNHLKVDPFDLSEKGELLGRVEFDEIAIFAELHYIVKKEYVLVCSKTF